MDFVNGEVSDGTTAFACFVQLDDARRALSATGGSIHFMGQQLDLNSALKKGDAESQVEARKAAKAASESRRNLHLAKLGLKTAADQGFDDLPPIERKKREAGTRPPPCVCTI